MIRRLAAVLALGAMGSVPIAPVPAHAASWYEGPCTDNVGITVVVDFQDLGGGVKVRCAPGPSATGLAALDNAGVSWEGTQRFPGVLCRIAGQPGPDVEPCGNTPPPTAYWSYWVAARGGDWCYSTIGAGNRTPPPGTIEGWSFALDRVGVDTPPPRFDPPAPIPGQPPNPLKGADCGAPSSPAPAPTTAPSAAPPPSAAPTTASAAQSPEPATSAATPPPAVQATTAPAAGSPPTTLPGSGGAPSTTALTRPSSTSTTEPPRTVTTIDREDSPSTEKVVSSAPSGTSLEEFGAVDLGDDGRGDGGFGTATAIGIVVAASLGGAGIWASRRRRALT